MNRVGAFLKRESTMAFCLFLALGVLSLGTIVAARSAQVAASRAATAASRAATTADVTRNIQDVQKQIQDVVSNSQRNSALFLRAYTTYTKCLKLIPALPVEDLGPAIDACATTSGLLPAK